MLIQLCLLMCLSSVIKYEFDTLHQAREDLTERWIKMKLLLFMAKIIDCNKVINFRLESFLNSNYE